MARLQSMFGIGVVAVCTIAGSADVAWAQAVGAAANRAEADLRNSFDTANLGAAGRTSMYAFSKQDSTVNAQVITRLTSNGVVMAAPAAKTLNGASNTIVVIGKDGKKQIHGPPIVALLQQPKSLIKIAGDFEHVVSKTGAYLGSATQFDVPGVRRLVSALADVDLSAGPVLPGSAAGSAYDPFTVLAGSSYDYAPTIDATLRLTDSSVFGGLELYALDSSVYTRGDLDNFIEDGSAFADALWTLSLTGSGPLGATSEVQVDFVLNPAALREIHLPSLYLSGLAGYSAGLSDAQVAALVDEAVESAIALAMTFDNGAVLLQGFALFPAGTQFQAVGGDVIYGEGANAVLTAVPEPATLLLVVAGLLVMGWRSKTLVVVVDDIVIYRDAAGKVTHSGIVTAVNAAGMVTQVRSKWGDKGDYRHAPADVPATYGTFERA